LQAASERCGKSLSKSDAERISLKLLPPGFGLGVGVDGGVGAGSGGAGTGAGVGAGTGVVELGMHCQYHWVSRTHS